MRVVFFYAKLGVRLYIALKDERSSLRGENSYDFFRTVKRPQIKGQDGLIENPLDGIDGAFQDNSN